MKTNFITSFVLSTILGFCIPFQHSLLSGMSPYLGIIANVILVIIMLSLVILYLFQKVKKYKIIQIVVAFLFIFLGTLGQLFFIEFSTDENPRSYYEVQE